MSPQLPEALKVALQVIEFLEAIGVRYRVGGSYASSFHGIPRQTQNVVQTHETYVPFWYISAKTFIRYGW